MNPTDEELDRWLAKGEAEQASLLGRARGAWAEAQDAIYIKAVGLDLNQPLSETNPRRQWGQGRIQRGE